MYATILPILTWGCQCWNFIKHGIEKLAVEKRTLKRKCRTFKRSTTSEMRRWKNSPKLKWHAQRLCDDRWPKMIENWKPLGNKKRWKPKTRWQDEITEHAGVLWRRRTRNRDTWKILGNPLFDAKLKMDS